MRSMGVCNLTQRPQRGWGRWESIYYMNVLQEGERRGGYASLTTECERLNEGAVLSCTYFCTFICYITDYSLTLQKKRYGSIISK